MQNRKSFLKKISLLSTGLFINKLQIFSNIKYDISLHNDDVIYYTKTSEAYNKLRKGFNLRINNFPHTIAVCNNTKGVIEAMQYARNKNLKVTVKSGGHCMEGFSSLPDGLVINLSNLNKIEWINNDTLKVGPACNLKQIYETIIPRGKYLPGGSCQTVGIGGLTLGGGYGLLSRRFGLTCDSLLEVTMVDGYGNIVNSKNNPELLWACKGGANGNFGTITEMHFKLQNAPKIMQSYKFRYQNADISKAKMIMKEWFEASKSLPNSCFSAFIFNGKSTYILLTNISKNNEQATKFINKFNGLSNKTNNTAPVPFGKALTYYYAEANPLLFKNASAGLYKNFDEIDTIVTNVFELIKKTPGILYQVNTLGGMIQNENFEKLSSFAHRDCFYFSELQAYWGNEKLNSKFENRFEEIQKFFNNVGVKAQYRNYPDINFTNSDSLYYGKNLERLLEVKKKYDISNNFGGVQTLKYKPLGFG